MILTQKVQADLIQHALSNLTYNDKIRLKEAYVEGLINKFKDKNALPYDLELLKSLTDLSLIQKTLNERETDIKQIIFKKIEYIIENVNKPDYYEYKALFTNTLGPYIKKFMNEILEGDNKTIINHGIKVITAAFAQVSFKVHADELFRKAQNIINQEIIKDIIE